MSIEGIDTSRDGGHPGLWPATDRGEESEWLNATNPAYPHASQQAWRRAIEAGFPWDGDIWCDPRTFMPLADVQLITLGGTGTGTGTGAAPEVMTRALTAASQRMGLVGADGREADSYDEVEEWADEEEDAFTISYVSQPEVDGDIVGLANIDTQGMRLPGCCGRSSGSWQRSCAPPALCQRASSRSCPRTPAHGSPSTGSGCPTWPKCPEAGHVHRAHPPLQPRCRVSSALRAFRGLTTARARHRGPRTPAAGQSAFN
jgi:hypothetical protein